MTLYYIDTCVWRDFYENRTGFKHRELGKEAHESFMKIIERKDTILFSEILLFELRRKYSQKEVTELVQIFQMAKILKRIPITREEDREAREIAKERNIPYGDCLQAIQARNHQAQMISQDKHLIKNLQDITRTKKPKEIT